MSAHAAGEMTGRESAHTAASSAVGVGGSGHAATALPEPEPRTATGVPTGRLGIWWFLASEIVIFGGLIVTYILFHMRHPEWGEEARHTITAAGALNTFVLLTSSLTMVLAHAAIGLGKRHHADLYLSATRILGGVFLIVKAFEYGREITEGHTPVSGLFWSFYYAMTGLHALHVVAGIIVNLILLPGGRTPRRLE
ncbi:MAG: cytochrome c oxidase subunit 3, partial [Candidatus Latescibacteria bacterium]|nr:cytochrome c oxidase subunit 3 [Candidatus Latescibacterota bacterium]